MKKERRFGVNHVTSEKQDKFVSASQAIIAMQAIQFVYALQGYLTSSRTNTEDGRVELCIHFEDKPFPTISQGYKYTWRDANSHYYWSEPTKRQERVRCLDYYFEYDK